MELELVHLLQECGFAAEKVSGMYKRGPDLSVPLLGRDLHVEVKARRFGFKQLYDYLNGADIAVVKMDRHTPLVVLTLKLALEIAKAAEKL